MKELLVGLTLLVSMSSFAADSTLIECGVYGENQSSYSEIGSFAIIHRNDGSQRLDITLSNGEVKEEACSKEEEVISCSWGPIFFGTSYALGVSLANKKGKIKKTTVTISYNNTNIKCL